MKSTTQIALSYIKENKSRSMLVGIAIGLTAMLLTLLGLCANGLIQTNIEYAGKMHGEYHGSYTRVNEDILQKLYIHADFIDVGKTETFGKVEGSEASLALSYIDEKAAEVSDFQVNEGRMPKYENEILAPKEFFHMLGYEQVSIGDKVLISYRIHGEGKILEKEFVISGFWIANPMGELTKTFKAITSKGFYEESVLPTERRYTVVFKINEELNYDETINKIEELGKDLGIDQKNIIVNKSYLMWSTNPGTETILFSIGIAIVIIIFSILIIYNIYYVGIIQKVQEYGKLRAIGTTKKQLKKIIFKEGMFIACLSIPIGLILGYLGSDIFLNYVLIKLVNNTMNHTSNVEIGKVALFNWPILCTVTLLSFTAVYLSLKKPMKIASRIPPIEAIRYQETNNQSKERKGYHAMNVRKLTFSNLTRNKKRTRTTIFTMGLSCVLFVVVANVGGNMDPNYSVRERYVEKGDFVIELEASLNDETYPENNLNQVQKQQLLDKNFISIIENLEGVVKVESRNIIRAKIQTPMEEDKYRTISVLTEEEFNKARKDIKKGVADYTKASKENGIIYCHDAWFEEKGYVLDQRIDTILYDGDREISFSFTLQGSGQMNKGTYVITEDTYMRLGFQEDMTTQLWITCKKNSVDDVRNKLESMMDASKYYNLTSYEDSLKIEKMSISFLRVPAYILLAVLGIIGFMNMANTLITSIITRKRELGILQAIGLTSKQLNRMLQIEGFIFTIGTLVTALTVGNLLGYLAFLKCKDMGWIGLNVYHFPVVELGTMIVILLLLQSTLTLYMTKKLQKDSLVERIRHRE